MIGRKELSFLGAGIGVGIGVALLSAPRSGAVTRRFIRTKANSAVRLAKDTGAGWRDAAFGAIEQGKHKIDVTKSGLVAAFEAGRDAYSDAAYH